jgi:CheY-like chemotaxis protein
VQLAADTKGIHIEVTADPRIRYIRGDATRLQQVVWNLLSNAVKFTPGGGRINVRLQRSNANVEISVSDTGEGIPSEFLPFIFERFSQADSSTTRRQGGLGLGLAIVRHLSELHGGSVSAESSGKGLGATFIVRLPLSGLPEQWQPLKTNQLNIATERYSRGAAPDQTLEGIRILIVDDNLDTLHMLAAHLSDYKATVETATSAAEALELLESYRPQVLVSDVAMPHEDGYSLISKIRKSELGNQNGLRAIALTALARVEDRARALSAGFNMFVPKPVEPMELVAAIVHLMQPDKLTGTDSDGSRL